MKKATLLSKTVKYKQTAKVICKMKASLRPYLSQPCRLVKLSSSLANVASAAEKSPKAAFMRGHPLANPDRNDESLDDRKIRQ